VHLHCCVIDGVFAVGEGGQVHFAEAVALTPEQVRALRWFAPSAAAHPLVIAPQMAAFGPCVSPTECCKVAVFGRWIRATSDAHHLHRPERPRAALLGTLVASLLGARSCTALVGGTPIPSGLDNDLAYARRR
jgi:hypothetical protein